MRWLTVMALVTLVACGGGEDPADPTNDGSSSADALPPTANEDLGTVLATVGKEKIGSNEFEKAAARQPAQGDALSDEEKREVLDKLVTEELLYQEAVKKGLYRDPKVKKIMVNLLLRQEVYASVRNSDFDNKELRAYFEEHIEEFVVPEKIQLKRIFVRVDKNRTDDEAKKLATDLHRQLSGGADFKDLAAQHSEDPYKRRGGDLGYVSRDGKPGIDPAVIDRAFGMDVGKLSEPFLGGGGYNILLVANRRERVERTFDQMKGSVLRKMKNDRYKDLTDEYIEKMWSQYTVDVDEAALSKIEIKPSRRMSLGPEGRGRRELGRPGQPGMDEGGAFDLGHDEDEEE